MADEKWSAFPDGGAMVTGDQLVGLRSGANTRLTPVIPTQVQQSAFNFAALGGSSNAFTVTLSPAVAALTDGMIVTFYSGAKFNTIDNPTLSVNGLPAVTIVCWSGGLAPNDITTATEYLCIYNLADNVFQLVNPSISSANTFEVQANGYNYALDTGVANAYIANILPAQIASILSGFEVIMSAIHANSGASTLTVNGVTHPILLSNGTALTGGEIILNGIYQFIYSDALSAFILINSSIAYGIGTSSISYTGTWVSSSQFVLNYGTIYESGVVTQNALNATYIGLQIEPNLLTLNLGNIQILDSTFTATMAALTSISGPSLINIAGTMVLTLNALTTLSFPVLTSVASTFTLTVGSLTSVSFPSLVSIGGTFTLALTVATSVSFPALIYIGGAFNWGFGILTSVTLPALVTVAGNMFPSFGSLTTFNCPVLTTIGGTFSTALATNLATLSMPDLISIGSTFTQSFPALTTLTMTSLTTLPGGIGISAPVLTTLSFPALTTCGAGFTPALAAGTSISADSLITITGALTPVGTLIATLSMASLTSISTTFSPTLAALTTLTLTSLTTITGAFGLVAATLTTLSLPALVTMGATWSTTMALVTTATFTNLATVTGAVTASFAALATLNFPAIITFGGAVTFTAANMVTFSLGSTLKTVGGNFTLTGAKLNQASVDGILVSLAALDGTGGTTAYSSKTINLSGGTSSAPSATGLAAKATLVARSCTVTTN